ncbi:ABC transporter permease [Lapidilactobacillus salsurivasis]
MLRKLAFSSIKSRLKDYVVLFSGLVVAAATFYMFMALATNQDFLGKNSMLSANNTMFIFIFGAILLAIITFFYLIYANSFLLTMRQREYGMFMMLGAKTGKIGQLIFMETFLLGMGATLIGEVIGIGLTQVVARLLVQQMGLTLRHFNSFYWPAFLITLAFFLVLFIFAAIWNSHKLMKTPVLKLLHSAEQPVRAQVKPIWLAVQALLGVALLAAGYWSMINIAMLQLLAIPFALVTIVLGSFFTFNATFIWLLRLMKKHRSFSLRGIRNFTLSQLNFRIHDYTRMLAMISILFALALGAITVGLGFHNDLSMLVNSVDAYDVKLYNHSAGIDAEVAKLDIKEQATYSYKVKGNEIYYRQDQLQAHPLYYFHYQQSGGISMRMPQQCRFAAKDYQISRDEPNGAVQNAYNQLAIKSIYGGNTLTGHLVTAAEFARLPGKTSQLTLIRVRDFAAARQKIAKIEQAQLAAAPEFSEVLESSKYANAQVGTAMYSGMIFMGLFLGLSFLAMLASCLMFKILSGAYSDVKRYDMLNKMGARTSVLKASVAKEIGVLYALPGLLGIIHVLFGLQLFKLLLLNPYRGIWLPFLIFLLLYGLYYWLTVTLYRGIVIPKVEIDK